MTECKRRGSSSRRKGPRGAARCNISETTLVTENANGDRNLRIGFVGLDTSHVVTFASLLNDTSQPFHVSGATVVAAFPGGSPDFELSTSRVEGFTRQLRDDYGVEILDSAAAVAQHCDAVLLTAVDGRTHLQLFAEIAPFGKPVFIDKPFATTLDDAREILALADQHSVPIMSCSSLRYSQSLLEAVNKPEPVLGADCFGPMHLEPTQAGFFWYGIHSVEMLYRIFGCGCASVTVASNEQADVITARWADGRLGTIRGNRYGNGTFGAILHRASGSTSIDAYAHPKPASANLLEAAIEMFRSGNVPIDLTETLEIILFIEAANLSRESGETVEL